MGGWGWVEGIRCTQAKCYISFGCSSPNTWSGIQNQWPVFIYQLFKITTVFTLHITTIKTKLICNDKKFCELFFSLGHARKTLGEFDQKVYILNH